MAIFHRADVNFCGESEAVVSAGSSSTAPISSAPALLVTIRSKYPATALKEDERFCTSSEKEGRSSALLSQQPTIMLYLLNQNDDVTCSEEL